MRKQYKVVLYGGSLFVVSIEVSLKGRQNLDVVRIDGKVRDLTKRLDAVHPDVIIFDLAMPQSGFMFRFLKEHPGVPLIGLDLSNTATLVLSSQLYRARSADDLAQIIQVNLRSVDKPRSMMRTGRT
jgi:DNA-binding NarL/FixJ family response regulator